jgi:hypothetical protein
VGDKVRVHRSLLLAGYSQEGTVVGIEGGYITVEHTITYNGKAFPEQKGKVFNTPISYFQFHIEDGKIAKVEGQTNER